MFAEPWQAVNMDNRPYYVHYTDALGNTKEDYAGMNATQALRVAAVIQAQGATGVYLLRKCPVLGFTPAAR